MNKPPLLITGAHGFLGTILSRHLGSVGYRVFLADFDVTRTDQIERFSQQCPAEVVILHLAGIATLADCERDPVVAHRVNADGPANVFRAFPRCSRFIFFSSDHVYKPKDGRLSESDPLETTSVYAQTKRAAEIKLQGLAADSETKVTVLRLFKHVHKTQAKNTFMSRIYHDLLEMRSPGSSSKLRVGNLDLIRDMSGVQDLNTAVVKLLESGAQATEFEIYNLASGHGKNFRKIVEKLADRVGVKPDLHPDQGLFRNEAQSMVGDPSRFMHQFGWESKAVNEDRLIDLFVADFENLHPPRSRHP